MAQPALHYATSSVQPLLAWTALSSNIAIVSAAAAALLLWLPLQTSIENARQARD
jgi:hypothetical protein